MQAELHWTAIAVRLLLSVAAGALLGTERSKTGHTAGLRTTILTTLAGSISMILMNQLMATNGKPPNSYVVMDLMRLPLGILTGVGFIGAGAIVHKKELVVGVTTAATLWYATVVGLCLGSGRIILGSICAVLGFAILHWLRVFEGRMNRYRLAQLTITATSGKLSADALRAHLHAARIRIDSISVAYSPAKDCRRFHCEVRWPATAGDVAVPPSIIELQQLPGLVELRWRTTGKQTQ